MRGFSRLKEKILNYKKQPYSILSIISDNAGWVLDNETIELLRIARKLGIYAGNIKLNSSSKQCIYYTSRYNMTKEKTYNTNNRLAFDYFHGLPGTEKIFDECYSALCTYHTNITRIRVSHSEMESVVLSSGIDKCKVLKIPIGINMDYFSFQKPETKASIRKVLGIPQSAVVIGSFQKDGNGWEEGLEPKLIKGPDVFLKTIEILKQRIPELWVLLTGPARGYVKKGLESINVAYIHSYLKNYGEIGKYFQALDLYLITSRQEGGPKAVLESMASGIPLVSTRVGQAMDLIKHGENGWLVEIEDAEGLAFYAERALAYQNYILELAFQTAIENSYDNQLTLWREFFKGFIYFGPED